MAVIKDSYPRALMLTHDLIGGKWKLRILWHIIHGNNRFSSILRGMPEISQKVLGSQLKEMEQSGLLEKKVIESRPPKVIEYHISEGHENIIPLVASICEFTNEYAARNQIEVNA